MRLSFSALAGSAAIAVACAGPVTAVPAWQATSRDAERHHHSQNPNVQAGGTLPPGGDPINYNDPAAVKGRVKFLWSQVEKYKPVEYAEIQHEYRDFGPDEYEMLSQSITQRPWQADFRRSTQANTSLPSDFLWGYASASAQVEGAVKSDGRGPSIWDWYAHRTDGMRNNDTFDIATNFRYMYPLDIKRVATMGAKLYSFSISWSRVMPLGRGYVSQEGLQFYKDLVKEIQKNGLKPAVTLQHWDIPLYLQLAENGLQNETYADAFAEYADVVLKALGPLGVEHWVSHNEPTVNCNQRYLLALAGLYGYKSPPKSAQWKCSGMTIKAHGRMNELFRKYQDQGIVSKKSQLSYKNNGALNVPWNPNSQADKNAVERGMDFGLGLFSDPIHSDSHDYPAVVKREVPTDWLPPLTEGDKKRLQGSADVYSTDYYSSGVTRHLPPQEAKVCYGNVTNPNWPNCASGPQTMSDGWPLTEQYPDETCSSWLGDTPGAFRAHLQYLQKRWPAPKGIVVTEFGWAEKDEAKLTNPWELVLDTGRQEYYDGHLNQIVQSIQTDGVKIQGAWLWSATSNVEWEVGKEPRFGVQSVNYTDPKLPRTYLGSSYFVKDFFQKHLG